MFDKSEGWEEVYFEDTKGRKYRRSIMTKQPTKNKGKAKDLARYNLDKRMTRVEFLKLPEDLRKLYIERLRETYCVGDVRIAEMLGMSVSAMSQQLKKIGARSKVKMKPSDLKVDAWQEFLDGGATPSKKETNIIQKQLHLEIVGKFDFSVIEQMVLANFDKEDNLRVSITISRED